MKLKPIIILAIITCFAFLSAAFAQGDTAGLFKTKCAACHGPDGKGKAAMKGTNLLTDEAKKMSDADLGTAISAGGAAKKPTHIFEKKGVTPEQTKSLVGFIRELQKK